MTYIKILRSKKPRKSKEDALWDVSLSRSAWKNNAGKVTILSESTKYETLPYNNFRAITTIVFEDNN